MVFSLATFVGAFALALFTQTTPIQANADIYVGPDYFTRSSGSIQLNPKRGQNVLSSDGYGFVNRADGDFYGGDDKITGSGNKSVVFYLNSARWEYVDSDNDNIADSFRVISIELSYTDYGDRLFGELDNVYTFGVATYTDYTPTVYTLGPMVFKGIGLAYGVPSPSYIFDPSGYWTMNAVRSNSYTLHGMESYFWGCYSHAMSTPTGWTHNEYLGFNATALCEAFEPLLAPIVQQQVDNQFSGSAYENGYLDGKNDGYNLGYGEGYAVGIDSVDTAGGILQSLFGAVLSVPIKIFNGLTPLAIFDVPIISIILSFVFLSCIVFLIKKMI